MTQTVYVELPLYDERSYTYGVSLEGRSYVLSFYWNQKCGQWHMDLRLEDRTPVLLGQALVPQYPLFIDYNLEELGMTGYFQLMPVNIALVTKVGDEHGVVPGFFKLYYVYLTEA